MIAGLELGQADEFPDNRFADEGECAPPFDLALVAHPPPIASYQGSAGRSGMAHGEGW